VCIICALRDLFAAKLHDMQTCFLWIFKFTIVFKSIFNPSLHEYGISQFCKGSSGRTHTGKHSTRASGLSNGPVREPDQTGMHCPKITSSFLEPSKIDIIWNLTLKVLSSEN
jgi:hypothetical protein